MKVYRAATGRLLPIDKPPTLQELKQQIYYHTSIEPDAQILLNSSDQLLEGNYHLNHDEIFIFDHLSSSESSNAQIEIDPPVELPILDLESHVNYARKCLIVAHKHSDICHQLYQEQCIQLKALKIASGTLQTHNKLVEELFDTYMARAQKEFAKHAQLLSGVSTDVETLNQIQVHHDICSDDKKLAYFIPTDKIFPWAERCKIAHENLVQKTEEMNAVMARLKSDYEKTMTIDFDSSKLSSTLTAVHDALTKINSRQLLIEQDGTMESSERNLDTMLKNHRDLHIPDICRNERFIRETVVYFIESKAHLTSLLTTKIQAIGYHQSNISKITSTLKTLNQALVSQSEAFLQILHLHRIIPAWGAALVEIVRRKEYSALFLSKVKDMADILSKFRAMEDLRRENFRLEIMRYLPAGLIRGLEDRPPVCEISVSNTKDTLPNIVRADLQSFRETVTKIHKNNAEKQDSMAKLLHTMTKMTSQIDSLESDFAKLIDGSPLKTKDETDKEIRIATLESELKADKEKISKLEAQVKQLTAENQRLSGLREKEALVSGSKKSDKNDDEKVQRQVARNLKSCLKSLNANIEEKAVVTLEDIENMSVQLENILLYRTNTYEDDGDATFLNKTSPNSKTQNMPQKMNNFEFYSSSDKEFDAITLQNPAGQKTSTENQSKKDLQITNLQQMDIVNTEKPEEQLVKFQNIQRKLKDLLDDSGIVLRLSMELVNSYSKAMSELSEICGKTWTAVVDLNDILDEDPSQLDFDVFMIAMPEFIKKAYSKLVWLGDSHFEDDIHELKNALETLKGASKKESQSRIAFEKFQKDDLVLFLPNKTRKVWQAFNVNFPHYYLEETSENRPWILAIITGLQKCVATKDSNPYNIPLTTVYYQCQIRPFSFIQ